MTDDLDQSLMFILLFFAAIATLIVVMVHLESGLTRPKKAPTRMTQLIRYIKRLDK